MTEARAPSSTKKWLWLALRIFGSVAGFAYVATLAKPSELWNAISRASFVGFALAVLVTVINIGVGALRWRVLLAAYGAPHRPPWSRLFHAYMIGFFYNNYLPGGVGGDVVRGVVTRQAFGEQGATASIAVVLVERALGLTGLFLVVSGSYLLRPLPGTQGVLWWSAIGIALAIAGITTLALGRHLARFLPGRLGRLAALLPPIRKPLPFIGALGLSLVTQTLGAVTGYFVMQPVHPALTLSNALVLVPLAMAASFFPLTVGGAGVREAAFVELASRALHMARPDAAAASLLMWSVQLTVAGAGGIMQIFIPFPKTTEPATTEPQS